jgi:hypothetical protein
MMTLLDEVALTVVSSWPDFSQPTHNVKMLTWYSLIGTKMAGKKRCDHCWSTVGNCIHPALEV